MSAVKHLFDVEDVRPDMVGCEVVGSAVVVMLKDKAPLPQVIGNAFGGVVAYDHNLLEFFQGSGSFRV